MYTVTEDDDNVITVECDLRKNWRFVYVVYATGVDIIQAFRPLGLYVDGLEQL